MATAKLKPIEERDPYAAMVLDAFDQQSQSPSSHDIPVKCTRCKHQTMKSTWVDKPKKIGGVSMTEKVCPKCGCRSYYDMRPQVAWCWATGLIEMGDQAPTEGTDGFRAIVIAKGPKSSLELALKVIARHGKGASAGKLLVPGVPEAESGTAAIHALWAWIAWCAKSPVHGCKDVEWEVTNGH